VIALSVFVLDEGSVAVGAAVRDRLAVRATSAKMAEIRAEIREERGLLLRAASPMLPVRRTIARREFAQ
jgi:hypothetical protein